MFSPTDGPRVLNERLKGLNGRISLFRDKISQTDPKRDQKLSKVMEWRKITSRSALTFVEAEFDHDGEHDVDTRYGKLRIANEILDELEKSLDSEGL